MLVLTLLLCERDVNANFCLNVTNFRFFTAMAAFTGGYDYRFVDPPSKSLECSICLLVVHNPHVTTCCGNHFCQSCVSPIQGDRKPCPLCKEPGFTTFLHKGVAREVNALKIYCPNKPQGCDWQGELGQVEKHLNPEDESKERGCGFVMVDCKYKCGDRFQKRLVKKHETENCYKRPSEKTADVASLIKQFSAEIQELKRENRATKTEMAALRAEVALLKADNSALKQQVKLCPLAPVPPFYFSLHNYEHYKEIEYKFFSPPFYSHHGGYKLHLQIYPNGCGEGYNTHLSVYPCTMMGEYDDELQWPFRLSVAIEMFNFTLEKWTEVKYITDYISERPSECVSLSYVGADKFVTFRKLLQHYLGSNSVHFRVTRVQVFHW